MKAYIIVFSFLIATACAASLGHHDDTKVTASSAIISEANVKPVDSGKHQDVTANKVVGASKQKVEEEEDCKEASKIGATTLEAIAKVLTSDEVKQADDISKSDSSVTSSSEHAESHVHAREIESRDELFGAGSQAFQSGSLLGFGDSGIASRLGGNIIGTNNLVDNGRLLQSGNLIYNQGASGLSGLGGPIQVLNSDGITQTGNQYYNAGGSAIRSGQINSGGLIQTGNIVGGGLRGANNDILISNNNYQSGNVGVSNLGASTRQIALGLDDLNSVPQTVEYSKQFYSFEAPEEIQEEGQFTKQLSNVLKKNLQVIFINAPENAATTNAALQLAKQAIEQRTAVYVLSKEAESAQVVGQLEQIQEAIQNKPEVKVIKYRTLEDLERAKQDIQALYEATGGSTESFNGGVVPVLNYASPAEARAGIANLLGQGIISSTRLNGGQNIAESSNVVSAIGGGQNSVPVRDAFLGSSVGQVNVIKSSNIDAGALNSGSSKYFQSGPVAGYTNAQILPTSGSSSGYTRELGSNSIVAPISNIPVNSDVALKENSGNSITGGSRLIESYNVNKNDSFGSSSSPSPSIASGGYLVGSSSLTGGNTGSSSGSSVGSGLSSNKQTGSQTGTNVAYNAGGNSALIGSLSGPTIVTKTLTSNAPQNGFTSGSSSGNQNSGTISSFGSGSQNGTSSGYNSGGSSTNFGSSSAPTVVTKTSTLNVPVSGFTSGSSSGNRNSGTISSFGSGSQTGTSSGYNAGGSSTNFGSSSAPTVVTKTSTLNVPVSGFTSGSSSGNRNSGTTSSFGSGSQTGTNSGYNAGGSSTNFLSSSAPTVVTKTSTLNVPDSGFISGSSSGNRNSGTISSFGSGLQSGTNSGINAGGSSTNFLSSSAPTVVTKTSTLNVPDSGFISGSNSGNRNSGTISSLGSGSSSGIGSGSSLGSNSGSQSSGSSSSFGDSSSKPTQSSSITGPGSYASHVTVESSKLNGGGAVSSNGHGSLAIHDGVSALSSTQIDHGQTGSASNKVELVGTKNNISSSTEKNSSLGSLAAASSPSVSKLLLPPPPTIRKT